MRLGIDARCLQDAVLTGVGEYTWQVLQGMARASHGPEIACWVSGTESTNNEFNQAGWQAFRSRMPNKIRNLEQFLRISRPLDEVVAGVAGKIDALWLPNPSFAHLGGRVPTVLTVHDLSFVHYPEFFSLRGRLWYFPAVKAVLQKLPNNSVVVAVSKHTADEVALLFPNLAGRIKIISPAVGYEYSEYPSNEMVADVRAQLNLPENYILSLGTIEPRKNYQLILRTYEELIKRNPNYPYDLVVAGVWGWRVSSVRKLLNSMKCRSRVHMLGYVPKEAKPALYRGARIFLYPSFFEGYGMPALEAMSMGTPVLASSASSLPEVVGNAGLLLDPWQPDAWLHAIESVSADDAWLAEMGALGRKRAGTRTWDNTAQEYITLFNGLL